MLGHHLPTPTSTAARAALATAAAIVTCSLFYGLIVGITGDGISVVGAMLWPVG